MGILVSIAFLQTIIFKLPIPAFRNMSQVHTDLLYSSMLCYECFAVSLLHMYAWNAKESWYDDRPNSPHEKDEELQGLTEIKPNVIGCSSLEENEDYDPTRPE